NIWMQFCTQFVVLFLCFHRGLIASDFTETHYLQDGTDVSLTRNYTGHCYYHGHVRGYDGSMVSLSTCSGLRGLIMFEDEIYILEPMKTDTDRYKLFPAKNLTRIWGSCGSHHNTSGLATDGSFPAFSQMRARRDRRALLSATVPYLNTDVTGVEAGGNLNPRDQNLKIAAVKFSSGSSCQAVPLCLSPRSPLE
ncbi:Disintegrin and metalloproteinase domain-containing protein 12, partial [Fukomys damarensis]